MTDSDRLDSALLKLAGIVLVGAVAVQFDMTIVNVAIDTLQQVGASFGTAVLAVILQHQAASHAASGNAGLATAFGHTFWWAVVFTALALVPALFLPARRPVGPAEETLPAGVKPQAA